MTPNQSPILFDHPTMAPCVIVGAGVAGHAARVWLASYKVPCRWVSKTPGCGGALHKVYNTLPNIPGHTFDTGGQLARGLETQLEELGLEPPEVAFVHEISAHEEGLCLHTHAGPNIQARTVILATGTSTKTLALPRLTHHDGAILSSSASQDAPKVRGRRVGVVGGGDAAFENALILARHGCEVHLFCRSMPCARRAFVLRVKADAAITVWPIPTELRDVHPHGDGRLRLELDTPRGEETLEVAGVFVRIGVEPVLPQVPESLLRDAQGYVVVDAFSRTNVPGLFAVGDLVSHPMQSVVSSASRAAIAAQAVAKELGAYEVADLF